MERELVHPYTHISSFLLYLVTIKIVLYRVDEIAFTLRL